MRINTINKIPLQATPARRLGAYPLFFWIAAALCLPTQEQLPNNDSKPQVRKEVYKNFSVEDSVYILNKHTETEYNIFGKVIQFTDFHTNERGKTEIQHRTLHKYDQQGNRIGTHKYNRDGDLMWSEDVISDANGRKVRTNSASYSPVHTHVYTLYEYDAYGNETNVKTFNDKDEQTSENQRTYTADGEIQIVNYWAYALEDNKLVKKTVRTENEYNDLGQIARSITDIQQGKMKWREIYIFERGYISEWFKYENSKLTSQFKSQKRDTISVEKQYIIAPPIEDQKPLFEPDDAKRDPFENIDHTPISTVTLKKDQNENIIKKVVREYGQVVQVTYCDYDEFNNLIYQKKITKPYDLTEEVFRSYDQHRNLLKESFLVEGKLVGELTYSYEYYE